LKAIIIEPNKTPEVRDIVGDYESVREIIDGDLEVIAFQPKAIGILDENSKCRADKEPVRNIFATYVVKRALATIGRTLLPSDFVAHTLVIIGDVDQNGEDDGEWHDVPQSVIDFVHERAAEFQFETV
jgi:hypothetical protein